MDVTKPILRIFCLWTQQEWKLPALDLQSGDNCLFVQEEFVKVLKQNKSNPGSATYQKRHVEVVHLPSRIIQHRKNVDAELSEIASILSLHFADTNPRKSELWLIVDELVAGEILARLDSDALTVVWYGHSSQPRPIDAYMYRVVDRPIFRQVPCVKGELPPAVVIPFRKEISPYHHGVYTA